MSANKKILAILIIILSIITLVISFDKIDPFYKTDIVVDANIKNLIYSTGKFGPGLRVVVETSSGVEYSFAMPVDYYKKIGDAVELRLYKRKITGAEKHEL